MSAAEPIAQMNDVWKTYETTPAVEGMTLEIRRGEIFGLLGPNGAGKTTTIGMLSGILAPTKGEIRVAGHDARHAGVAMKRALGVVPQELAIYLRLTGRENLEFFGEIYGLKGAALAERVLQMLALVGLTDRADSRADTYSGGMKRRLNLAAGLMHAPQLLLLDEPTVGVDPQSRNHIFEGVRQLNRQGLTVLYTSHYMEEVEALCDRVGIMDRGKLIACDTVPNLIARLGGTVIEIGVDGEAPTEAALSTLRTLEKVDGVEYIPTTPPEEADTPPPDGVHGTLHVRSASPNQVLPNLISALNAASLPLMTLNIKRPNLEDVFLALTGNNLRD